MTWRESLDLLKSKSEKGDEIQIACTNPHWWIGFSSGVFYWQYECCEDDACGNAEYESFDSVEDLDAAHSSPDNESRWEVVKDFFTTQKSK